MVHPILIGLTDSWWSAAVIDSGRDALTLRFPFDRTTSFIDLFESFKKKFFGKSLAAQSIIVTLSELRLLFNRYGPINS